MNIAMVSVHTNPVSTEDSSREGIRVHVAELARELDRQGHRVTIYTRRDSLGSGERVRLAPRVNVKFISGNACRWRSRNCSRTSRNSPTGWPGTCPLSVLTSSTHTTG